MSKFRNASSSGDSGGGGGGGGGGGLGWGQGASDFSQLTFCLTPLTLVRFLAAVDIAKAIGGVAGCAYVYVLLRVNGVEKLLKMYGLENIDELMELVHLPMSAQRGVIFLAIGLLLLSLLFSALLYTGAQQRNYPRLRYWFIYQLTILLLYIPLHVWTYFYGLLLPDEPHKIICGTFILIFFTYVWQGYHLYVTALLITEITSPDANSRKRWLKNEYISTSHFLKIPICEVETGFGVLLKMKAD